MCAEYRAIHKVIVKYRNLILRLHDMHDELHGLCLFLNRLEEWIHHIRMKECDERKRAFKTKCDLYQ